MKGLLAAADRRQHAHCPQVGAMKLNGCQMLTLRHIDMIGRPLCIAKSQKRVLALWRLGALSEYEVPFREY